jgi:hypothetical protein
MPALKNGKVYRVSRSMQCPALRFDDFVSHRKPNQVRQASEAPPSLSAARGSILGYECGSLTPSPPASCSSHLPRVAKQWVLLGTS